MKEHSRLRCVDWHISEIVDVRVVRNSTLSRPIYNRAK